MIFAAGLGTRLKPLTNTLPKALAPFNGKPLLWHAIKSMENVGVERIVVNVHHFASQIIDFITENKWQVEVLVSDESNELLDTGGGLVNAMHLFVPDKPILIRNADIIASFSIEKFISSHRQNKNDATLLVKSRNTSRYLSFDKNMALCGWKNTKTGEQIVVSNALGSVDLAFSGMHIIEPTLVDRMGEVRPFSIIKAYLELANDSKIVGYEMNENDAWFDVGTLEKLKEAELYYKSGK